MADFSSHSNHSENCENEGLSESNHIFYQIGQITEDSYNNVLPDTQPEENSKSKNESNLRQNLNKIHLLKRFYKYSLHYNIIQIVKIYITSNDAIKVNDDMILNTLTKIIFLFKTNYWDKMNGITEVINSICE